MSTKVFISWSGDLSKQLAEALRNWLPAVLQFVKPYFTPDDVEKGTRWGPDVLKELNAADTGIICLTKSNLERPWILFEAGALSKSFDKAKVCTLLFDLEPTDVKGPLTVFQHTRFERSDVKKLVSSINKSGAETKLDEAVLESVFDMWWPRLEESVAHILASQSVEKTARRSERDILEEILELTRVSSRHRGQREVPPSLLDELTEAYEELALLSSTGKPEMLPYVLTRLERPLGYLVRHFGSREASKRLKILEVELGSNLRRIARGFDSELSVTEKLDRS